MKTQEELGESMNERVEALATTTGLFDLVKATAADINQLPVRLDVSIYHLQWY